MKTKKFLDPEIVLNSSRYMLFFKLIICDQNISYYLIFTLRKKNIWSIRQYLTYKTADIQIINRDWAFGG